MYTLLGVHDLSIYHNCTLTKCTCPLHQNFCLSMYMPFIYALSGHPNMKIVGYTILSVKYAQ